jgi:hypothetical protein
MFRKAMDISPIEGYPIYNIISFFLCKLFCRSEMTRHILNIGGIIPGSPYRIIGLIIFI